MTQLASSVGADVMVHKIDACMLDLLEFHTAEAENQRHRLSMGRRKSSRFVRTQSTR